MSGNPTHYEVLGVSKNATYDEIKESFHHLARAKHPDKQLQNRSQSEDEQNDPNGNEWPTKNSTAAEFRTIQQAWKVLRDDEERSAYDSDLLHKDLHEENKRNGAIVLGFHDDLEEAVDEDTNERFMVYDCRCGEEIYIDVPQSSESENSDAEKDDARCKEAKGGRDEILVDCPGCCFVYRIIGK